MAHNVRNPGFLSQLSTGLLLSNSICCLRRKPYKSSKTPKRASSTAPEKAPVVALDSWGTCRRDPYKSGQTAPQPWRGPECGAYDCGEDSFLITPHVLGVADGVGGWRYDGIDPSHFANKMMQHCKQMVEDEKIKDPLKLMQLAYDKVLASKEVTGGGSTCCLAALFPGGKLHIANLGDSGLIIVRDGQCIFRADERTHMFNAPFQLSVIPENYPWPVIANLPKDSFTAIVDVKPGDVIVMGSDGVFDNLFVDAIALLVKQAKEEGATSRAMAELIRDKASEASLSLQNVSPFQVEARQNNFLYQGGKSDDITVIVAQVVPQA